MGLETLQKYGMSLTNVGPQALLTLREKYEAEVKVLKGEADKEALVSGGWVAALTSSVENNPVLVEKITAFKLEVREMMYALIDEDTDMIIPLIDAFQTLKSDMMNERDYYVQKIKRSNEVNKPGDEEFNAKLAEMTELGTLIREVWSFIGQAIDQFFVIDGEPVEGAAEAFAKEFPTKDEIVGGAKSGKTLPDLSRLPNKRSEGSGRNSNDRFLRFLWTPVDGEPTEIPNGTLVADVAHDYVSNIKLGVHVNGPDLRKLVEESGQEWGKPWRIEFASGSLAGSDVRKASETVNPDRAESLTGVVLPAESGEN
jgi:hypothetical protein